MNKYEWAEIALEWPVDVEPIYRELDMGEYVYGYFSPFRPLTFVYIPDVIIIQSADPTKDFMFTKVPLDPERIYKWEIVPYTEDAKKALQFL